MHNGLIFLMIFHIDTCLFHLLYIEIRIGSWNDSIELLIAKHSQPFRFDDSSEPFSEIFSFFFNLFVTFEIGITHNEIHLILTKNK